MHEGEKHRPETLPEQLHRVGTALRQFAWLTRGRWAPVACVLAFGLLGVIQRALAGGTAGVGLGSRWVDLLVPLLGGAVGTAPIVIGLWTGISDGSAVRRWAGGFAALLLISLAPGTGPQFPWDGAGLSAPWFWVSRSSWVQLWGQWASVGLLIRGLRFGVFRRTKRLHGSPRVSILDLMLLTAAFAAGVAGRVHAMALFEADQRVVVNGVNEITLLASLPLWFLATTLPLAPVLIGSFPRGSFRTSRVVIGSFVTLLLLLGPFNITAILAATSGLPGGMPTLLQLLQDAIVHIGTVGSVVGVAVVTRWAGFRLRALPERHAKQASPAEASPA